MKNYRESLFPHVLSVLLTHFIALLFFVLGSFFSASAQVVPEELNYQAVIRDGGTLLTNQGLNIEFTLLSGGVEVYKEVQNLTTDDRGLIQTEIGDGTPSFGSIEGVPWESGDVELSVSMDVGNGFVFMGTSEMESVPFSMFSEQVADISDHNLSALSDVEIDSAVTGDVLTFDGDKWTSEQLEIEHPWQENGNTIHYDGSSVGIRTSAPTSTLTVRGNTDLLDIATSNRKIRLTGVSRGSADFTGSAGSRNAIITNTAGSLDNGFMGIYNTASELRAYMEVPTSNVGRIITRGPANTRNAVMTWLNGCIDCGYISVYDANSQEAGMYVNSSGQGIVFGDVKNFRMEHPTLPGKEIWYASLEGPEAGAYDRGTAQLINGKAEIFFSEHFEMVAASEGMTVVLTPLSGSSKGLAVINKSGSGFEVVELFDGKGTYGFDWEVKAIRKGYEDYRVIRDASESRPGGQIEWEREHEKNPAGIPTEND
ncbi:MAG: hypothetical protein AAF587_06975 [Bacteroidota bacterium]